MFFQQRIRQFPRLPILSGAECGGDPRSFAGQYGGGDHPEDLPCITRGPDTASGGEQTVQVFRHQRFVRRFPARIGMIPVARRANGMVEMFAYVRFRQIVKRVDVSDLPDLWHCRQMHRIILRPFRPAEGVVMFPHHLPGASDEFRDFPTVVWRFHRVFFRMFPEWADMQRFGKMEKRRIGGHFQDPRRHVIDFRKDLRPRKSGREGAAGGIDETLAADPDRVECV